ncbi:hypothetical protein Ancab_031390 [Ancistrocladus abbreviatus]
MQEGRSPSAIFCLGQGNPVLESQLQNHNLVGTGTQQKHEGCPPSDLRVASFSSITKRIRQKKKADTQGMHLIPGQTWQFLMKIGAGGVDDSDMMVRHLAAMEARDVSRYEQAVAENIAEDAEADNGTL